MCNQDCGPSRSRSEPCQCSALSNIPKGLRRCNSAFSIALKVQCGREADYDQRAHYGYMFGCSCCLSMPDGVSYLAVDMLQRFVTINDVCNKIVLIDNFVVEFVRNNHVNIRMGSKCFANVIEVIGSLQLKQVVDVPMAIANSNVPSWIIRMLCKLCRKTGREVTMIQPRRVVNLEELSFYPAYQPHQSVWIVGEVIHRIDKARAVLRELRVKCVDDVVRNLGFGNFSRENICN